MKCAETELMVSPCFTFLNDSYLGWWSDDGSHWLCFFLGLKLRNHQAAKAVAQIVPNHGLSSRPKEWLWTAGGHVCPSGRWDTWAHGWVAQPLRHFFGCWTCRIYRIFKQETKRKRPSDGGSGVVWPCLTLLPQFYGTRRRSPGIPASPIGKKRWQRWQFMARSRSKWQQFAAVEERGPRRRSISVQWQRWQVARVLAEEWWEVVGVEVSKKTANHGGWWWCFSFCLPRSRTQSVDPGVTMTFHENDQYNQYSWFELEALTKHQYSSWWIMSILLQMAIWVGRFSDTQISYQVRK